MVKLREQKPFMYMDEEGRTLLPKQNQDGELYLVVCENTEEKVIRTEKVHKVVFEKYFIRNNVRILTEVELEEKEYTFKEVFRSMTKEGIFSLDMENWYSGYTFGETWNGWQCPCFTKETGLRIMAAVNDEYTQLAYNEEMDAFIIQYDNCDGYGIAEGAIIPTPEGKKRLYAIGSYEWTWCKKGKEGEYKCTIH